MNVSRVMTETCRVGESPLWNPAEADSYRYALFAYDYDPDTGSLGNKRLFIETEALGGMPDGATVDEDGRI